VNRCTGMTVGAPLAVTLVSERDRSAKGTMGSDMVCSRVARHDSGIARRLDSNKINILR
jgi:hypothetical protein